MRLLLAPRLAALELNRIKLPESAKIPWDFQVLKILLVGLATGRWGVATGEWIELASDTRVAMAKGNDKELWSRRLRKVEELVVFGLMEGKV